MIAETFFVYVLMAGPGHALQTARPLETVDIMCEMADEPDVFSARLGWLPLNMFCPDRAAWRKERAEMMRHEIKVRRYWMKRGFP